MSQTSIMPSPKERSGAQPSKFYGFMAEFTSPAAILRAAEKVHDAGYKWFDCHVPFPVHGLDKAMGVRPTILPWLVFGGGFTGCMTAIALQTFTNSSNWDFWFMLWVRGYQFWVSGKPPVSGPAFVPVTFEFTVLLSALTAFGGMLVLNGLPQLYHPCFKCLKFARATDDRFFLVIESRDPKFSRSRTQELLESLSPESIEELES